MGAIIDIQLRRLRERLADHRIALELDGAARAFLVERGYDPAYGARPLKRAITRYLETPLAREIIAGDIPDGSTVAVEVTGDHLAFTPVIEGEVVDAG
jgi:ATP-dependent Clp protease ATP-binding subunit ClpB